jgi:hypothetical protein
MNTTWIRVAYGVVLGLILFFTIQFGVAMVLPGPEPPGDPGITFRQLTAEDTDNSQNRLTASIDQFYGDAKNYRDDYVDYQRNTFLATTGIAAIVALIAILLPAAVNYLRWGLLLGAGFALLWGGYVAVSPVPSPAPPVGGLLEMVAMGEPEQLNFAGLFLRFAISFVGFILLLFIGLWRLTEWPAPTRRPAAATAPSPAGTPQPAPAAAAPAATAAPPAAASAWAPAPVTPPAPPETSPVSPQTPPPADSASPATATDEPTAAQLTPPTDSPPSEAVRWQRPPDAAEPDREPGPSSA